MAASASSTGAGAPAWKTAVEGGGGAEPTLTRPARTDEGFRWAHRRPRPPLRADGQRLTPPASQVPMAAAPWPASVEAPLWTDLPPPVAVRLSVGLPWPAA